jgi:hypothetical protein
LDYINKKQQKIVKTINAHLKSTAFLDPLTNIHPVTTFPLKSSLKMNQHVEYVRLVLKQIARLV